MREQYDDPNEVQHRKDDLIRTIIVEAGVKSANSLYSTPEGIAPDINRDKGGDTGTPIPQVPQINIGIHREATITTIDPHAFTIFNRKKAPDFHGDAASIGKFFKEIANNLLLTTVRQKKKAKANASIHKVKLGVDHINHLLEKREDGGLVYI
ncbi:hypothetical protein FGADI_8759 [Fusarium gaditjirri]|uniref:Uncharacterized protein n=1 Tax=Fusarium gaditjirri TaxID=282569 RepID=A0A8H4WTT4_9HYPO|nr:hypothetical protein FGADI_8759 [Fusarium gaditjirri]